MNHHRTTITFVLFALLTSLAACANAPTPTPISSNQADGAKPKVVATTTIVGDVVRQVGGDLIDLTVLLPAGADPHGFQPKPQDTAHVAEAGLVFVNGLGLEEFLDRLLQSAGGSARIVAVSDGVQTRTGEAHEGGTHEGIDPHVWMDPNNVRVWTRNIAAALSELDPANAAAYQANAEAYDRSLQALDAWAQGQIDKIAPQNRQLVVDHDAFGYLAQRYGLETVGTVVPGYSTMSAPSAQELARLEDAMRELGARVVFVDSTVNPTLSERVAADTGAQLVFLFTGSLSEAGGGADTYEAFVRYNITAIVEALK